MATFQTLGTLFNANDNGRNYALTRHSLEVPDGTYTIGDALTVTIHEGTGTNPESVDVSVTFIGYESVTFYPIFRMVDNSDFRFQGILFEAPGRLFGTNEPDPSIANPSWPTALTVPSGERYRIRHADNPNNPSSGVTTELVRTAGAHLEIDDRGGRDKVAFENVGIREGTDAAGSYQFLGEEREIPVGNYAVGDTEVGGTTLILVNQDGEDNDVEFVGYQTDTNYPIFKEVGEDRYFLLADEPGAGTTYTLGAAEITTGAYTTCFAPGTLIATPDGERAVETLKPGDRVLTADGDTVPVKWLGMQKVSTLFGPREQTLPVRIRAGALDRKVPHTDLVVTKDHGMIVDGVICHAGALINGTSITEVPARELNSDPKGVVTYYHVETEGHVPLLANGAVAESFIDQVHRAAFTNHAEFVAMYGARVPAMTEMNMPRAMSMRQVPKEIQSRLARRAAIIMAPSGGRRLWQGLRDWARAAGRRTGALGMGARG